MDHESQDDNHDSDSRNSMRESQREDRRNLMSGGQQPPTYLNEDLPEPPRNSEVFVGGLSKDVTTEDLLEKFSKIGTVKQIRLMKEANGKSKGFAFIKLCSPKEAERAIRELDSDVLKGKKFGVVLSQDNHKLFIGNISKDWTQEDILNLFREHFQGVQEVSLIQDPQNSAKNRGFCFVEFDSHASAARAHGRISRPDFRLGTLQVSVDWAEPVNEPDEEKMAQVKSLYVGNLPKNVTEEEMKKLFEKYGELEGVTLSKNLPSAKRDDFGFVNFKERSGALAALDGLNNYHLHDHVIQVSLAKPVDKSFKHRLAQHTRVTPGAPPPIPPPVPFAPYDYHRDPYYSGRYDTRSRIPPYYSRPYDLSPGRRSHARDDYAPPGGAMGGSMSGAVGGSMTGAGGSGEFFCHVCQISLSTYSQLEQHLEGRAHERALAKSSRSAPAGEHSLPSSISSTESRKRKGYSGSSSSSGSSSTYSSTDSNPKAAQRTKYTDPYASWSGYYPTSSPPLATSLPPSVPPHSSSSSHSRPAYTAPNPYASSPYSYDQHYSYPYPYSTQ